MEYAPKKKNFVTKIPSLNQITPIIGSTPDIAQYTVYLNPKTPKTKTF